MRRQEVLIAMVFSTDATYMAVRTLFTFARPGNSFPHRNRWQAFQELDVFPSLSLSRFPSVDERKPRSTLSLSPGSSVVQITFPNGFIHPADAFWAHYLDNADRGDKNLTDTLKGDTDGILIFTGLFAATVGTFLTGSLSLLQPDPQAETEALLSHISLQIASLSNGTSPVPAPSPLSAAPFEAPVYALIVNALWFLSLLFSVICALCATLVQQWTRTYFHAAQRICPPHVRGPEHIKLSYGLERFHLRLCVEVIVSLIHIAVTLFLAGLAVVLYNLSVLLAYIFLGFCAGAGILYVLLSATPIAFDDAPFRTPLTPLLILVHTYLAPNFRHIAYNLRMATTRIRRSWPFRRFQTTKVSANVDLRLLRMRRAMDLSLRAVDQNRQLEAFVEALPGLVENTNSTRDAHDIVLYLRDQDLLGRLCQSFHDPNRTSLDAYGEVLRTLSCITTFRLLMERFVGPEGLLFPSHSSLQLHHGLEVLNRLAASEDPEWVLHASCTLASMTATLLRVYAHIREPFDPFDDGLGVLRGLLKSSEIILHQSQDVPHPLGGGFTSHFHDALKRDGRLCNLVAFVSSILPHLPNLKHKDRAIVWKCMALLEPETMGTQRASRWLVARFHVIWLDLQDQVNLIQSDEIAISLQILQEYLRPLAASIDLSRTPYSAAASSRQHQPLDRWTASHRMMDHDHQ